MAGQRIRPGQLAGFDSNIYSRFGEYSFWMKSYVTSPCFSSTLFTFLCLYISLLVLFGFFGFSITNMTLFYQKSCSFGLRPFLVVLTPFFFVDSLVLQCDFAVADFAVIIVTILLCFVFMKIINRFDLIAFITKFGYDLVSHFRFPFKRTWLEPLSEPNLRLRLAILYKSFNSLQLNFGEKLWL